MRREKFGKELTEEEIDKILEYPELVFQIFGGIDNKDLSCSQVSIKNANEWSIALARGYLPKEFESVDQFIKKIEKILQK
ncbi:hypothetical protein A2125_02640 [Candidatus Woesebacteria bacterium GWB1_43_5]|uniref:Uncharacterized protein n=1 Tax=Candidatus Woesebacteria bacterium GWB1_43_5 TaxID=1802474 RepID=A0A1F7WSW9_9BACT|nr:MAG: hypothetical protein A2125_02640 [Candidatus Woesebacteria bacterium GWB1_43_5]